MKNPVSDGTGSNDLGGDVSEVVDWMSNRSSEKRKGSISMQRMLVAVCMGVTLLILVPHVISQVPTPPWPAPPNSPDHLRLKTGGVIRDCWLDRQSHAWFCFNFHTGRWGKMHIRRDVHGNLREYDAAGRVTCTYRFQRRSQWRGYENVIEGPLEQCWKGHPPRLISGAWSARLCWQAPGCK